MSNINAKTVKIFKDGDERPLSEIMSDLGISFKDEYRKKSGFNYVSEFGNNEERAEKNIDLFLNEQAGDRRIADKEKLLAVWGKCVLARKNHAKERVAVPDLPEEKEFDLSESSIKLECPDNVERKFDIPTSVSKPAAGDQPRPEDFDELTWLAIVRKTGILHGVDVNKAFSDDESQYSHARAPFPALAWYKPKGGYGDAIDFDTPVSFTSKATYSSKLTNGVHNLLIGGEIHGSCPYGAAKASGEYVQQHAKAQNSSRLYVSAHWRQPYATINLTQCTRASTRFLQALRAALKEKDKFAALERVFEKYGHVASTYVQVGGVMYFSSEAEVDQSATKDDVEITAKVAADVKAGNAEGGGSAEFKKKDGTNVNSTEMSKSVQWSAHGGDKTTLEDPKSWSQSLRDPNLWSICERGGKVRSLIDWLKEDVRPDVPKLAEDIEKVWRDAVWGGRNPPAEQHYPVFHNRPFLIKTGPKTTDFTLKAKNGKYVGRTKKYDIYAYKNVDGLGESGTDFLWTLVWTGHTTGPDLKGDPIYAVVTWGSEDMAASLRRLDPPSGYCIALSAWDTNADKPVAHASSQLSLWALRNGDRLPLETHQTDATDINPSDVFWTVTPIIDDTTDLEHIERYRLVSLRGRGLHKVDDSRGESLPDAATFLRLWEAGEKSEIYLIPVTP